MKEVHPQNSPWMVVRELVGYFIDGVVSRLASRVNLFAIRGYIIQARGLLNSPSVNYLFILKISISLSLKFYGSYFASILWANINLGPGESRVEHHPWSMAEQKETWVSSLNVWTLESALPLN